MIEFEPRSIWRRVTNEFASVSVTLANAFLLCLNIILLALAPGAAIPQTSAHGIALAKPSPAVEMLLATKDVYLSRHPYTILVPKTSRAKGEFSLLAEGVPPLVVSVERTADGVQQPTDAKKTLSLSVASQFSFSCDYSSSNGLRSTVHEFTIRNGCEVLTDLNADGKWDIRILYAPGDWSTKVMAFQIWYRGAWRDAVQGDRSGKQFKRLLDGTNVCFDMARGLWAEASEGTMGRKGQIQGGDAKLGKRRE